MLPRTFSLLWVLAIVTYDAAPVPAESLDRAALVAALDTIIGQHPTARRTTGLPPNARLAAALATVTAGPAMALLLAEGLLSRRRSRWRVAGSSAAAVGTVAVTLILFQAAAARRVPTLAAVVPPALLLLAAGRRYGRRK